MTRRSLCLSLAMVLAAGEARATKRVQVELRWNAIRGAAQYDVQIWADLDFSNEVAQHRVENPRFVWDQVPSTPHYWRVRGVTGSGSVGKWSGLEVIPGTLKRPVAVEPKNRLQLVGQGASVELHAKTSRFLAAHHFEVASDEKFRRIVTRKEARAPNATVQLGEPGRYYWRVIGVDVAGNQTPPSNARRFDLRPPAPSSLVGPSKKVTLSDPPRGVSLKWTDNPAIKRWRLEIKTTKGTDSVNLTKPNYVYVPTGAGQVSWRVRGLSSTGWAGVASSWRGFVLVAPKHKPEPVAEVAADASSTESATAEPEQPQEPQGPQSDAPEPTVIVASAAPAAQAPQVEAVTPVPDDDPSLLWIGAQGGVATNFGLVSPWLHVSLEIAIAVGAVELGAAVGIGFYRYETTVPAQMNLPESISVASTGIPLNALGTVAMRIDDWRLALGVGPYVELVLVDVGQVGQVTDSLGGELSLAGSYSLGPGEVFLDMALRAGYLDSQLVTQDALAARFGVGYRFGL